MPRRDPFKQHQLEKRKTLFKPVSKKTGDWRGFVPRDVARGSVKSFIKECADEIDSFCRVRITDEQESVAATNKAIHKVLILWEQLQRRLNEYPVSIRFTVAACLKVSEPGVERVLHCIKDFQTRARPIKGHRPKKINERMTMHAQMLQLIVCKYSQSSIGDWKALKRTLEKILTEKSDVMPPGKNAKVVFYQALMFPKKSDGGVDIPPIQHGPLNPT